MGFGIGARFYCLEESCVAKWGEVGGYIDQIKIQEGVVKARKKASARVYTSLYTPHLSTP